MVAAAVAVPHEVSAGPLLDWLLGRQTAYYPAYPGVAAQTSYYPGTAGVYNSAQVTPITSFYGTGNVYPTATYAANYPVAQAAYSPVQSAYSPSTTMYSPVNTNPTTVSAYPAYPAYRQGGLFDGVRQLFRPFWPWGSGYTTVYYPAQVTYYRPTATVVPGTTLPTTSMSACSSYQMQVQRLPSASLLPEQPSYAGDSCGCRNAAPTYPMGADPYGVQPPYAVAPGGSYPGNSNPVYPQNPSYPSNPVYPQTYNGVPSSGAVGGPSDIVPVPQPQLSPTSGYYNGALPQLSAEPVTNSVLQPIVPNTNGASYNNSSNIELRPNPAPQPSWQIQPSLQTQPTSDGRSADSRDSTFKTIQWTSRRMPVAPSQPQRPVKYDDSGWK